MLGWPVGDSDAQLEASTGRTARELRELDGKVESWEEYFNDLSKDLSRLQDELLTTPSTKLSVFGGARLLTPPLLVAGFALVPFMILGPAPAERSLDRLR